MLKRVKRMSSIQLHLFKYPPRSQNNSDDFQTSISGKSGGKVFLLLLDLRIATGKLFLGVETISSGFG